MCDPSYIKEKWDKYIGFDPKNIDLYIDSEEVIKWRERWNVDDSTYNKISSIIAFIVSVSEKHFYYYSERFWMTSDLITLFEKLIGSAESINKDLYNHLHPSLIKIMDNWKDNTTVSRDYQLCLLV
jgi:hypothetical protein